MSDLLLINRDLPGTDDEERIITDAQLAAQNIAETLLVPLGSLPYNRAGGSRFASWRNATVSVDEVLLEIERVAREIPEVLPQTVRASYDARTTAYSLSFTAFGESVTIRLGGSR